jgi:HAD superfamily hydrolase (TIGR01509 family)
MASSAPQPHPGGVPIRALLWDVDGTLAETELEGHRRAFNRAFAEEGLSWRWDVATYLQLLRISGGRERMRAFCREGGHVAPEEQIERLQRRKQVHYEQLVRSGAIGLRPGVRRLIGEACAAGLQQAIVTTSGRASVQALAEGAASGLAEAFAFWVCGEDVQHKKPHPEGYLQALDRLGLQPDAVLAIEDSRNGLQAARGAGLDCLVTLSDSSRWEAGANGHVGFEAALAVLDSLGEPQRPLRQHRGPDSPADQVSLVWLQRLRAAA